MRTLSILILIFLTVLVGCVEKDDSSEKSESFRGTYRVYNPAVVGEKIDSVTLTIESEVRYRFAHTPFRPGVVVDICNSSGMVEEFGTNFATFFPESVEVGGCDSIRIPRDVFTTDFQNHGDTIYMDRDDDSLVYEIRLLE
ncbi:MAG: hypothetical protein OEV49_08765 [candidate division Zixibacteria bacterium]|nr:hypothetical protein [candidate division Zixibacteria bacterium]MDH3936442.1 hypothetical protein [candidate division Zixibacteria bacterium]MDH4032619.1 hypothetical protein [candidate division Zixibacteria bacterium]